ncbi:MAG: pilus assembly protein PilP [Alcanivoracaceae bacterium]|jgi:type IV pilus assembly protein PilP|nr:pilus assembly protein PilP [Alcanivoracaceae bacterium]
MMISRQIKIAFRSLLAVVALASMSACGGTGDFSDLQAKMAEIKARPRGRIEPPPEFAPIASVSYSVHQLRGPFTPPVDDSGVEIPQGRQVEPDFTRPREYLERFTLDSLKMVGSISRPGQPLEVLVKDPTGTVNRARVGNHMGKNFGRIIDVSETSVGVLEIVPDGQDGWVERARTIKLAE